MPSTRQSPSTPLKLIPQPPASPPLACLLALSPPLHYQLSHRMLTSITPLLWPCNSWQTFLSWILRAACVDGLHKHPSPVSTVRNGSITQLCVRDRDITTRPRCVLPIVTPQTVSPSPGYPECHFHGAPTHAHTYPSPLYDTVQSVIQVSQCPTPA